MDRVVAAAHAAAHHDRLHVLAAARVGKPLAETPRRAGDDRLAEFVRKVGRTGGGVQQDGERLRIEF